MVKITSHIFLDLSHYNLYHSAHGSEFVALLVTKILLQNNNAPLYTIWMLSLTKIDL